MTTRRMFRPCFYPDPEVTDFSLCFSACPLPAYSPFMKYQTNLREEEIKNRLRQDYFDAYGFLK